MLEGVYLGAQYWHQVDTPLNKQLVAATRKAYGINPNYPLAADYIGTKVMLEAIIKAGSLDGAAVSAALQGMRFQGPTGEELIRPGDHQVLKDYYLLRGKPQGQMRDEDDLAFSKWLVEHAGVAAIPLSPFYERAPDTRLLRLCFAKSDATMEAAAERLCRL